MQKSVFTTIRTVSFVDVTKFACESQEFLKTDLCYFKWSEKLLRACEKC